jgi:hypothetical protein
MAGLVGLRVEEEAGLSGGESGGELVDFRWGGVVGLRGGEVAGLSGGESGGVLAVGEWVGLSVGEVGGETVEERVGEESAAGVGALTVADKVEEERVGERVTGLLRGGGTGDREAGVGESAREADIVIFLGPTGELSKERGEAGSGAGWRREGGDCGTLRVKRGEEEGAGEDENAEGPWWLRERMGGRVGAMKGMWGVGKLNVPRCRVGEVARWGEGVGERVGEPGGEGLGVSSSALRVFLRMLLSLIVVMISRERICCE